MHEGILTSDIFHVAVFGSFTNYGGLTTWLILGIVRLSQ